MAAASAIAGDARQQHLLAPCVVDQLASETPGAAFGVWPRGASDFYTVTYGQLANAVNGLARWLVTQLGRGSRGDCLTYIGPNDMRYTALLLAAVKTGYGVLLTSPRNSPDAHSALFVRLGCRVLITTDPAPPAVGAVVAAVEPRTLVVPGLEELLNKQHEPYAYDPVFAEVAGETLFIIHTSGSTGIPKPMIWTLEAAARQVRSLRCEPPAGSRSLDHAFHGKRVMVTLPPFHGAGLTQYIYNAISCGVIPVIPSTAPIPTAQGVVDALKRTPADVLLMAPSVVAELARSPELLDYCAEHLEMIMYIGGDLPTAIGDQVAARIKLRCQWGASEVGIPPQLMPAELGPMDWSYIRFHPCVGAVFEQSTDETYELVIRQHSVGTGDHSKASTQPTWAIKGIEGHEGGEYRTRDLFERHPSVPDAWRWLARADDIIVFLNGEKTNPVSMEQHILASNPELIGVITLGAQRFQAALLLEPAAQKPLSTSEQAALIERVWSSVHEANQAAPAHARVEKALMLVAASDRPFVRAGKGTIQRGATVALYRQDIDELYARADLLQDDDISDLASAAVNVREPAELARAIRACVRAVTEWPELTDEDNFFERGMDSLQGLQLTRALRRSLARPALALSTVYQNPSVRGLVAATGAQESLTADPDAMEPLLEAYRKLVHQIPSPKSVTLSGAKDGKLNVILTGSTGQVGTFLLHSLLKRTNVGRVFCLNRTDDGGRRVQLERFATAGLDSAELEARATFQQVDVSRPLLGLDKTTFEALRDTAGLFIHNGWPVNFNLPLSAFQAPLAGLVNVLQLASAGAMRVMFVSSVSAIAGLSEAGYARSKFVGERLCDAAAAHLGLPFAVVRLGQVAGAAYAPSAWSRAEWLPSLVAGSVLLGCVPDALGPHFSAVDFVPVDVLGEVMADLALPSGGGDEGTGHETAVSYYHVRNPHPVPWTELLPAVLDAVRQRTGKQLRVVSPSEWLARLRESDAQATAAAEPAASHLNPALRLREFYHEVLSGSGAAEPLMVIDHTLRVSPALRDLPAVKLQWIHAWVDTWID